LLISSSSSSFFLSFSFFFFLFLTFSFDCCSQAKRMCKERLRAQRKCLKFKLFKELRNETRNKPRRQESGKIRQCSHASRP
jgi:hypothetical protein